MVYHVVAGHLGATIEVFEGALGVRKNKFTRTGVALLFMYHFQSLMLDVPVEANPQTRDIVQDHIIGTQTMSIT